MKNPALKRKISGRIVNLTIVCLLSAVMLFAWQKTAELQSNDFIKLDERSEKPVVIHSANRGNPHINFRDGRDLISPHSARSNNASLKVLASADFDSDGIADLVTASASGILHFYKGNDKARRGDVATRQRGEEQPFDSTDKTAVLNVSPDFLFAGDFNADGRQDVLAAAKGANFLVLLHGDGRGNFSPSNALAIDGQITAAEAGEIGRKDGQTDLAVAVQNKNGAFLLVFEHPESAFKHKPEIYKLSAPAANLAIGNLDDDFYADIAAASGNDLTIIHGRGQAYPWDLAPELGIKRPAAIVATRRMPFQISALTVGRFGGKRGESPAILGTDGNIYHLEPNWQEKSSNNKLPDQTQALAAKKLFVPTNAEVRNLATIVEPRPSREEAEKNGAVFVAASEITGGKFAEFLTRKQAEAAEKFKKADKDEMAKMLAENMPKAAEYKERAKAAYLRSISGKPSTLSQWKIDTLVSGGRFINASAANDSRKMLRVNVSDSRADDILLLDSVSNQIQVISQIKIDDQKERSRIASLEVENGLLAILPMRLNVDALSDLVVLRGDSPVPSVVMTAPAQNFIVTSTDETGDCQGGNPCSLRNAITLANQNPGADSISFGGAATIAPDTQLPVITDAVTIYSPPGDNGLPQIEITGVNIQGAADGLKVRGSNIVIGGLVVNEFTGIPDNNGSVLGGSGITIESTTNSPDNGNNWIFGNYLGTDRTGSFEKGNDAAGLNIFDSDNNQIGGSGAGEGNVMSGNNGVGISVTAGNDNKFWGNIVGLNSLGTGKVGNKLQGLFFAGANNSFGGDGAGEGNTVSGNGQPYPPNYPGAPEGGCYGEGMFIPRLINLDTGELLTFNNNLKGNRMGTNPAGTVGLGNCSAAVATHPHTQTVIGSITQNGRNIVSDNGWDAIHCTELVFGNPSEGGFCAISGNNIGTDITGTYALPNDWRNHPGGLTSLTSTVEIDNNLSLSNVGAPGGTTPGGACTGHCNLISGNGTGDGSDLGPGIGVVRTGYGIVGVFSNYIGTNQNGDQPIPNVVGVLETSRFGETYIGLGVPNEPLGNVISGNQGTNLFTGSNTLFGGIFSTSYIEANLIGTDKTGTFSAQPAPNGNITANYGIAAADRFGGRIFIGDAEPAARNIISGHKGAAGLASADGIRLYSNGGHTKVVNNLIGLNSSLNPLGNQGSGIVVTGSGTQIGGSTDQESNQIAWNGTAGHNFAGVLVTSDAFGVTLRNNSIHDNIGLGIDLSPNALFGEGDGVTANDCQDTDLGANDLQNYPELLAPIQNGDGTVSSVPGVLRSLPGKSYAIDFYSSQASDPTNYGEGAALIGSINVMTNTNGFASFVFNPSTPVSSNLAITATATDDSGSTSEFSCAAGQCAPSGITTLEEFANSPSISCVEPIIVNISSSDIYGDDSDENLNDGVCDVKTDIEGLQCSLRAAIEISNNNSDFNFINFNIPGGGVQTISPVIALPTIAYPVYILGTSQPGYSGSPLIKLDGSAQSNAFGLKLSGGSSTVTGLTVVGFQTGIVISGSGRNTISGCHIGINSDGITAPPQRQAVGIEINGSANNKIGGISDEDQNNISNNIIGIGIYNNSTVNKVINNRIGADNAESVRVPNDYGIVISNSTNNEIGDELTGSPNFISGNNFDGVTLQNNAAYNNIAGNYIGVGITQTTNIPNHANGVAVTSGANNNFIGGFAAANGNIIGGHTNQAESAGIFFNSDAGINNRVLSNKIGVGNLNGTQNPIPNQIGIKILASKQIIGQNPLGVSAANLIGKNLHSGIFLDGRTVIVSETIIQGNNIGTDGDNGLGNGTHGINLLGDVSASTISRNVISGNNQYGIAINGGDFNKALGNKIGTSADGMNHINNGLGGIYLKGSDNIIGGDGASDGNLISGNALNGISVVTGSSENKIIKNLIGTTGDGANALENSGNGILLLGKKSQVVGNTISGNALSGIRIERGIDDPENGLQNLIAENLIGTTSTGDNAVPNFEGIMMDAGAISNTIATNVISGNLQNGLVISRKANGNLIQSNYIGTTKDGMHPLGNFLSGIFVEGSGNQIAANVISGNNNGMEITKTLGATVNDGLFNSVKANKIGTNKLGTAAIPNQAQGIELTNGANNNTIGGLVSANEGNLISGNNQKGVYIYPKNEDAEKPFGNRIYGNYIGTNAARDAAIPNVRTGIVVYRSDNNFIGNSEDTGNVVSGNLLSGIVIFDGESIGNRVNYNFVGLTRDGIAIGNNPDGINIDNAPQTIVGNNNICGNSINGISVNNLDPTQSRNFSSGGDLTTITISGNRVGTFKQTNGEVVKIANGENGIALINVKNALVGDTNQISDELKNIISGNGGAGIMIEGEQSSDNIINNSIIGTDENGTTGIGNDGDGIYIKYGSSNNLGGSNLGNIIAGNGRSGVRIDETAGQSNLLDSNAIFGNQGLGIDIGFLGHSPNDLHDADEGANRGQNYPELTHQIDNNNRLVVNFKVDSAPATADYGTNGIYVEFFKTDASGEGEKFLGYAFYTVTDYNSGSPQMKQIILGDATVLGIAASDKITATATDAQNNSSEFAPTLAPTAANVKISGRLTTVSGESISNARVSLTDSNGQMRIIPANSFGYFQFTEVESGRTYIIGVQHKRYVFVSQIVSVNEEITGLNFTPLP